MPTCYRKVNGKYYSPSEYKKLLKKKYHVRARRKPIKRITPDWDSETDAADAEYERERNRD